MTQHGFVVIKKAIQKLPEAQQNEIIKSTERVISMIERGYTDYSASWFTMPDGERILTQHDIYPRDNTTTKADETRAMNAYRARESNNNSYVEGYDNRWDTNKDGFYTLAKYSSSTDISRIDLDDTKVAGSGGKDHKLGLQIEALDQNATGEGRTEINLGENDYIDTIEGPVILDSTSTIGDGITTVINFKQENKKGASRTISITLPTENIDRAIERLPEELQTRILQVKNRNVRRVDL